MQQTEEQVRQLEQEKYNALRLRMHEEMARMQDEKAIEQRGYRERIDQQFREKERDLQDHYHSLISKQEQL